MAMKTFEKPSHLQRQGREFWALVLELQSESAIDIYHSGETMAAGCLEKSGPRREQVRVCAAGIIIRTSCRNIIHIPKLTGRRAKQHWPTWLLRGGFPPALQLESDSSRDIWFSGYSQSYLERDLRQLSAVSSLPDFIRFMALAAQRTARILNQTELSRDAALSQPSCHRYLNLLETGCLITRLPTYATNPTTSLIKAKKLLWNDCGLAAWLAGIKSVAALHARTDQGFWLEQTIFQSLQTWRILDPANRRIYYWRDRSGQEIKTR